MKKTNLEKGITLIALIITIVVLLILAVVTINSIQGDGIISKAKQAADNYTAMANDEQTKLNTLLSQIEEANGDSSSEEGSKAPVVATWEQSGTTITGKTSDGKTLYTLAVGDKIGYDCYTGVDSSKLSYTVDADTVGNYSECPSDYLGFFNSGGDGQDKVFTVTSTDSTKTWNVIGVENDKLLISTNPLTTTVYIGKYNSLDLGAVCAIYGHGNGAESGRSIEVKDFRDIAGATITYSPYDEETIKTDGEVGVFTTVTFNYNILKGNYLVDNYYSVDHYFYNGGDVSNAYSPYSHYYIHKVTNSTLSSQQLDVNGGMYLEMASGNIKPVVVLKTDITLEKNETTGAWDIK